MQYLIKANILFFFFSLFSIGLFSIGSAKAQKDTTNVDFEDVEEDEDAVYQVVEKNPKFPGGDAEMMKYIQEELDYPEKAQENGVEGVVYLGFIVEKDGSLSNIQVKKGIGSGCDKEAKRVISDMPKWKPGKQRGKPVRVSVNIPIRFKLSDDSSSDQQGGHETKE